MAQFVWTTAESAWLVTAKDRDEAYRKVIANRLKAEMVDDGRYRPYEQEALRSAVRWFAKKDELIEIAGELEEKPYEGELPEPDYSDALD